MNVRVVAAVLGDAAGRVLIAQRPPGKHMAGYWEFPGGKLMPGESAEAALSRELTEELGVHVLHCHPLLRLQHEYDDRVVELEVFVADEYRGVPAGLEGQALKWVTPVELAREVLLPADRPIVEAIAAAAAAGGAAASAADAA
ncbi:MAG: 8-oxo-dGTP diphosphatase MutT [Steroidobacteraceae bacterium]